MPYKHKTKKIPPALDARRKLTDQDRESIRDLAGALSQRKLAKLFDVSRRLIQFILDPAKKEEDLRRRAERGGSAAYYKKEVNTLYMRRHRRRKQKLYLEGKLV